MISIKKYRLLVGLCSWNNPNLLKKCISSLIYSMDLNKDGIAVVLNESDIESITYLHNLKIPFISVPENSGPLGIDFLLPFVQHSEFFINSNDDMLFHPGFADDLISIIQKSYPCTASCRLIENFDSNNAVVTVDTSLPNIDDDFVYDKFIMNYNCGKYKHDYYTIGWMHPICISSKDFLEIGGYSGNWDLDFLSGYGRDDMFPFLLKKFKNYNFICSKNSFVYHGSSASMKRLPDSIRQQHNIDKFHQKAGISLMEFRNLMELNKQIREL